MTMPTTLRTFLDSYNIHYDMVIHDHTDNSLQTATAGHIPVRQLAKAVVMEDHDGHHLLAVLPADRKIREKKLSQLLHRDLHMVNESEVEKMFVDCEPGAIPAIGLAYQMETIIEDSLLSQSEIFFEAGDHKHLVHMGSDDFKRVTQDCWHCAFSVSMYDDSPYTTWDYAG
jgi:Ala-tRNA(Pro) deacylase